MGVHPKGGVGTVVVVLGPPVGDEDLTEAMYWALRTVLGVANLAALGWVFVERSKAVERYRQSPAQEAPPSRVRLIAASAIGLALGALVLLVVPLRQDVLLDVQATVFLLLVMAAVHYRRIAR